MPVTAFFSDERCFWHSGDRYAFLAPVGGLVQPLAAAGLPENPEGKRRLKNLLEVTGLMRELDVRTAEPATDQDLLRVHTPDYIAAFRELSAKGGGELGQRTPFGPGGYEIAALSVGLVKAALLGALAGEFRSAYALARPPGHHCLPHYPMGFCLLANIAIAIETAIAAKAAARIAIVDWDVHHGNGTEAIFIERPDVLTISLHQDRNYPLDTGSADVRGSGPGEGFNINIPLAPGAGHDAYLYAFDRIVVPALRRFRPEAIVVASGFDASGVDPLSRTMAMAVTFGEMTRQLMAVADEVCAGRIVMAHEGGYSEVHVPFCGHAVIQTLAGSGITAPDPLEPRIRGQQPGPRVQAFHRELIDELADLFATG
ncbi:MAG: class II histone deacetylase [Alphaproteobacteria bacterium]